MGKDEGDGGKNDENEDDIYADIGDFHFDKELAKLENKNKAYLEDITSLSSKLQQLTEKNMELQCTNDILVTNISILLKTAKAEIERKQLVIDEFRKKIEGTNRYRNFAGNESLKMCENCVKIKTGNYCKINNRHVIEKKEDDNNGNALIEEGEIPQDELDENNEIDVRQPENASNKASDKCDGSSKKSKRREHRNRSRDRSSDKYSSGRSHRSSGHGDERHSHRSRSRHYHRHRSSDSGSSKRKRSRERTHENRETSSRHCTSRASHKSDHSGDRKKSRKDEKQKCDNGRRSSSSQKQGERCEGHSEKTKKSEKTKEERTDYSSAKEIKPKDLKLGDDDDDDDQHCKVEIKNSEKEIVPSNAECDNKKLNLGGGNSNSRKSDVVSHERENVMELFTRESVLAHLYEEPVIAFKEMSAEDADDDAKCSNEEQMPYLNLKKKPKATRKPKQTLYSRRMEARLLQMQGEEAAMKKSDDTKKPDANPKESNGKKKQPARSTEFGQKKGNSNGASDCKNASGEEKERGVITNEDDEKQNPMEKADNAGDKEKKSGNASSDVPASTFAAGKAAQHCPGEECIEAADPSPVVTEKCEDSQEPVETVTTPQKSFGGTLIQKLLQLQNFQLPKEIKEFSPLKNNYKLCKFSPLKPITSKQHILEYYNLMPSAQQWSNLDLETFDSCMSLPITPGKNGIPWCSTPKDSQESMKGESDDASDKLRIFDEDKSFEDDEMTDEKLREKGEAISPVTAGDKMESGSAPGATPDAMINENKNKKPFNRNRKSTKKPVKNKGLTGDADEYDTRTFPENRNATVPSDGGTSKKKVTNINDENSFKGQIAEKQSREFDDGIRKLRSARSVKAKEKGETKVKRTCKTRTLTERESVRGKKCDRPSRKRRRISSDEDEALRITKKEKTDAKPVPEETVGTADGEKGEGNMTQETEQGELPSFSSDCTLATVCDVGGAATEEPKKTAGGSPNADESGSPPKQDVLNLSPIGIELTDNSSADANRTPYDRNGDSFCVDPGSNSDSDPFSDYDSSGEYSDSGASAFIDLL